MPSHSALRTVGLFLALSAAASAASAQQQRPALPDHVIHETDVEYGRAGQRSLRLDILRPKQPAERPRPVVVWVHGGGWQNGDKSSGRSRLALLAATGDYVCVSVGYRLSGEATWPAQIHDCKAAIRWLRAHAANYQIDPQRIGVWGGSAGGHLVSLLGTSGDVAQLEGDNGSPGHSSRVQCVVDFCGPSSFPAFAEQSPRIAQADSPVARLLGGPPGEKRAEALLASPVTHVSTDDPPFLIVHGTADATVPLAQAELLHAALKQAGVESTLVRIEGGGHSIGGAQVEQRVQAFLDRHLLGREVEVSDAPIQAEAAQSSAEARPRMPSTVEPGASLVEVFADDRFFEGPSWDAGTGKLYFTAFGKDNQQILRLDAPRQVAVWLDNTEGVNGTFLSRDGRLLAAQAYGHRLLSYGIGPDGPNDTQVLVHDARLNQPNDVCQTARGHLYFTDPDFRQRKTSAVYRLDAEGRFTRVIDDMPLPNGLIASLDGRTLYVADSHEKLWRSYPILDDGDLGPGRVFFQPDADNQDPPDGMTIDADGNLYLSGRGGVWVVRPDGRPLGLIATAEFCSNVTFGGREGKTLYLTCRGKVYSLSMSVQGGATTIGGQ